MKVGERGLVWNDQQLLHLCSNERTMEVQTRSKSTMDPDKAVRFGNYLKQHRQAKGLSARALARAVGANDATIVRIEQGAIESPRPNLLSAIARELGLPLSDVFAYADYVVPQE